MGRLERSGVWGGDRYGGMEGVFICSFFGGKYIYNGGMLNGKERLYIGGWSRPPHR